MNTNLNVSRAVEMNINIDTNLNAHVYGERCTHMYICICICLCICIYIYTYVHMYVYTHMLFLRRKPFGRFSSYPKLLEFLKQATSTLGQKQNPNKLFRGYSNSCIIYTYIDKQINK